MAVWSGGSSALPFNETNPNDQARHALFEWPRRRNDQREVGLAGRERQSDFSAQLSHILEGRSYINFHTTQFTGGETRGAILQAVPEPASILLLFAGAIGLFGACRRKGSV